MTIRAVSYESLALGTVVPYPLPFARFGNERAFSYWWRLLYFALELPSPHYFPSPPGLVDAEFLHRYCDAAREMAGSACLAHPSSVSIEAHRDDDGRWVEMVSSDFPPSEVVRGFIALFRQFYSDGELAPAMAAITPSKIVATMFIFCLPGMNSRASTPITRPAKAYQTTSRTKCRPQSCGDLLPVRATQAETEI